MKISKLHRESGESKVFFILMIVFIVLTLAAGGGFAWAFTQMNDYKNNSDEKVASAVETAKKEQKETLDKKFEEDYKKPYETFTGPTNYGSVTFEYPKTWAVYVDDSGNGEGAYSVYFSPKIVPTIGKGSAYALRMLIYNSDYATALDSFKSSIDDGYLTASTVNLSDARADDPNDSYGKGTRLDGQFTEKITGSVALFGIRGATLALYTDSGAFANDFNNTILKTLKYKEDYR